MYFLCGVLLVASACGGSSGDTTNNGFGGSTIAPGESVGDEWKGTWARKSLRPNDTASTLEKAFFQPSVHYLNEENEIIGLAFLNCMVSPQKESSDVSFASYDWLNTWPETSEKLRQLGGYRYLFIPHFWYLDDVEVTGDAELTYDESRLGGGGNRVSKVSSDFRTNSLFSVNTFEAETEQYAGCTTLSSTDSEGGRVSFNTPVNLWNGKQGVFYGAFSFTREPDNPTIDISIDPERVFASLYAYPSEDEVSETQFIPPLYSLNEPTVKIDSYTSRKISFTLTGQVEGRETVVKGILYPDPADWLVTLSPVEAQLTSDLSYANPTQDRDGDLIEDYFDQFPDNPLEWIDSDADGIADNADTDDDNDGTADLDDRYPQGAYYGEDTDADGEPDQTDQDDDNDGVVDARDALPRDSTETIDTDADGIGNNADNDDDNDGIADSDDLVPLDNRCGSEQDAIPGECVVDLLLLAGKSVQIGGIVYFTREDYPYLFPMELSTGEYFRPVKLTTFSDENAIVTELLYSLSQQRIYVGFSSGVIIYLEAGSDDSIEFYTLSEPVFSLAEAGSYILARGNGNSVSQVALGVDGSVTEIRWYGDTSEFSLWDDELNTLLYKYTSDSYFHTVEVNQENGQLQNYLSTPGSADRTVATPPIALSPDGRYLLSGSGFISSATTLEKITKIVYHSFDAVLWDHSAGLLTLSEDNGSSLLQRYTSDYSLIDAVSYPGTPIRLLYNDGSYYVLTLAASGIRVQAYLPSNDSDTDTVFNLDDAFPFDAAASIDTDRDGAPDQWNIGYSASNSTTELTLDRYPFDAACYRAEEGDNGTCDHARLIPKTKADQLIEGSDGIVYLLFKNKNLIYRWNASTQEYLPAIQVGVIHPTVSVRPLQMVYAANSNRLYLRYPYGKITYIGVLDDIPVEAPYVSLRETIRAMAYAGDHVMIASGERSGSITYNYYDVNGEVSGSSRNYAGDYYAWHPYNRRLYFTNGGLSFDQLSVSGEVTAQGTTLDSRIYDGPVFFSADGSRAVVGGGQYVNAETLDPPTFITRSFKHAVFLPDGRLAVLARVGENAELAFYNTGLRPLLNPISFEGIPAGLVHHDNKLHVFTHTDTQGTVISTLDSF